MTGDEVLAVRARRALYEFVRASPGYHLREIARATNLSITLADYHLHKRFYPKYALGDAGARPALTDRQKVTMGFLRQSVPLQAISFLMERESALHGEILMHVRISASTLTHHMKKLLRAGIVARDPALRFRVADGKEVARLMVTYEIARTDQIDAFLRVWGEFRL
ncbi:MAG: ArsR family transcriptional regulator [Methanobacteriota archaeon]|nr:MAG: ArsR family transcriptional regulator [Euryarchaeota archaeon]